MAKTTDELFKIMTRGGMSDKAAYELALELGTDGGASAFVPTAGPTGLNGNAPVAKAAAIASPTAPSAAYVQAEAQAMKTAVDAIRTALTNIGITA